MTPSTPDVAAMRQEYADTPLRESSLAPDWPTQFGAWLADAVAAGLPEPNAMVLATADPTGRPSARTVLLKGYGPSGFVFFTNYTSRKATELDGNPHASVVFLWLPLHRQVVVCGRVTRTDRATTEDYFATRSRDSQLGAWASPQSQVVAGRATLDDALAAAATRFPDGVPAPPHWGGYELAPETVEFWQGRTGRLHDRLRYRWADGSWVVERLGP